MSTNDDYPNSLVDLDAMQAVFKAGDQIPLRDGRMVDIESIEITGIGNGQLPVFLERNIIVHVKWFDPTQGIEVRTFMPIGILLDVYIDGNITALFSDDIKIIPVV